jgi:hypothetical protein
VKSLLLKSNKAQTPLLGFGCLISGKETDDSIASPSLAREKICVNLRNQRMNPKSYPQMTQIDADFHSISPQTFNLRGSSTAGESVLFDLAETEARFSARHFLTGSFTFCSMALPTTVMVFLKPGQQSAARNPLARGQSGVIALCDFDAH